MSLCLGIDTSNYTTSAALFDSVGCEYVSERKLLPVKQGERGLRQSDAVFHHTVQLAQVIEKLGISTSPDCVGVSLTPTLEAGSYMPCFLVGEGTGRAIASSSGIPLYGFSHQQGHIASAVFSAGRQDLLATEFLAFHVSGGTTQAVKVFPDDNGMPMTEPVSGSSDLNAGQAVDRLGVRLSMSFPAGRELDALSLESSRDFFSDSKMKLIGLDCSLSGLENKCNSMLASSEKPCDVAKFLFDSIARVIFLMAKAAREQYGDLPVVFSGGVMSNTVIRGWLSQIDGAVFASRELSSDNAVGTALLAALAFERDSKG